jgi:hypothetical protein
MPFQDMLLQCQLNIISMIVSTLNVEHIVKVCKSTHTKKGQVCDVNKLLDARFIYPIETT